ncbi:hypothetical protein MCOR25_000833 [Pyricularia grisea]|uniref:Only prolin and serin are matching in the corresponding protein n=1 Tax=Pyricularia grisea TaxID=148305 RepID=A0A6P8AQQ1_PYRGI|nr:uncharacterized protein PgNI_11954 [Pyricularia grisea]KAI6382245.1 hypothetical protein MCOR25_000833 [Pyricularia grisea]TLD04368.1 hypothetical protein PgNI_11954 [Pyricularia grisea]
MPAKLKPLLLPQMVEDRRKEADQTFFYLQDNISSSEMASPVTPTFSQRDGHMQQYSSSTSSLELSASYCSDSSVSPAALAQVATQMLNQNILPTASTSSSTNTSASTSATATKTPTPKRSLPDVQEEPFERDGDDTLLPEPFDFPESLDIDDDAYCLCSEICEHHRPSLPHSASMPIDETDHEMDFMSDSDYPYATIKRQRGRSGGNDSPLSGLASRIRLPSISRWRSTERRAAASSLSFSPASETTLDYRPSMSIGPSSRSSSVSRGRRPTLDRTFEPPLPPTPALSFYESSATSRDSISVPTPLDIEAANELGRSLEREREMATTPLLPPLMTKPPPSTAPSAPQSPLEFPKIEPYQQTTFSSPELSLSSPQYFPAPALSTKPSISSFRHYQSSSISAPATACPSEVSSPMFNLGLELQQPDSWSDRLGHANFTILPKPYVPQEVSDLAVLEALRADWNQARINFTKHLVRTGEHYGATSKTYQLTEEKWAEIELEWRLAHDTVVARFSAMCNGNGDTSEALRWRHQQEDVTLPSTVPVMLDGEGGKFPAMGDEDIVGPMIRDAAMSRELSPSRQGSASRFWRSIVGRVNGMKK